MRMALVVIAVAVSLASCGSGSRPVTHVARAAAIGEASGAAASLATRLASAPCVRRARPVASLPTIDARTAFVSLAPKPFGAVTTADGKSTFVSLSGSPSRLAVMAGGSFPPRLVHLLRLPMAGVQGLALTPDGHYLLAAAGNGATILDVAGGEQGAAVIDARLADPAVAPQAGGAIQVVPSPDGRYAFVTLEFAGKIAVFDLRAALRGAAGLVGTITLGTSPIGMAISPDGRWLYAASEVARGLVPAAPADGAVTVIDLRRAERDPAGSIVASASAGCAPLRLTVSADGRVVWLSARDSDAVLAFSASRLRTEPSRAVLAAVRVGAAPVGMALVGQGRRLVVADSDQFNARGGAAGLVVIDPARALAGSPALLGEIPTGRFPREVSVQRKGETMLVTNYGSGQLEAIAVGGLAG
jgi:DNA-binding beta-propeller fold protein YncE